MRLLFFRLGALLLLNMVIVPVAPAELFPLEAFHLNPTMFLGLGIPLEDDPRFHATIDFLFKYVQYYLSLFHISQPYWESSWQDRAQISRFLRMLCRSHI